MSQPLYELVGEFKAIDSRIDELLIDGLEEGSTLDVHMQAMLDATDVAIEQKVENILRYITNLESDEEAIGTEIKRLQARKQTAVNKQNALRTYLLRSMQQLGEKRIKTSLATATRRAGAERLEIDEGRVWEWPQNVFDAACTTEVKVSKTALKEFKDQIKAGELPGAVYVQGDETLMIK